MNRKGEILLSFLCVAIIIVACSKRIIPGLDPDKGGKSYDSATYNYLFVDAIKDKLVGNISEAIEKLQNCIEINPDSDASYYQIAQILLSKGDMKNGKKYIKEAVKIEPGNQWYQMMLAGIYYQERYIDSAIICYENAIKSNPEKYNLRITLSNLYAENDKSDKAKEVLEDFDKKYGSNEKTSVTLIKHLIVDGEYDKAENVINELLNQEPDNIMYNELMAELFRSKGENDEALDVYKKLVERNPNKKEIQISLCMFLNETGNYDELFKMIDEIITIKEILKEEKVAIFRELIANNDLNKRKADRLIQALMILEDNYKNDEEIVLLRPEALIRQGRVEDAADILEDIVQKQPGNYFACERLLMVYYEGKDFKKLFDKGEICATRFNRSFIAKMLYATGAIELGKYDIALEEIRKANILAGDSEEMLLQVLSVKADVHYRMNDLEKAFDTYEEAIKINNDDIIILNNYAYYLAEKEMRLKEAEKMAEKVIEREGNNTTFLDTYAWVLFKRGKVKKAAEIMERIINSGEKEDAEWFEHYGYILKKRGRCDDAVLQWEKALRLDSTKDRLINEIDSCKKK